MKRMASFYTIVVSELYYRGYSYLLLKCTNEWYAQAMIEEMHEGICGIHVGSRALMAKILRAGYFWSTMKQNCLRFVKSVTNIRDLENWNARLPRNCIVRRLFRCFINEEYLLSAIDYFTKWIEVEPLPMITTEKARKFVWRRIMSTD